MKVREIISESKKIDEAPIGALGQIGRKLGSAALNVLGAKNAAADLGGRAEMGDRANQYYTAFRRYLAQTGKDEQSATYADVDQFMKKNNLPSDILKGQKGLVDPKFLNQAFVKIAQDYFAGKSKRGKNKIGQSSTVGGPTPTDQNASTSTAIPAANTSIPQQNFSVPALMQVIPQMRKRDLDKILKATQDALAKKPVRSRSAGTTTTANNKPVSV